MFLVSFYFIFKSETPVSNNYDVHISEKQILGSGLDLKAVGELLKKAKDAKEFETMLNDPKLGVNNLDLNADGVVDYIKVTEFGSGDVRGYSLSTEPKKGEIQEIATIKIEKKGEQEALVETKGNEKLYGPGHYYQSPWSGMATGMLMGYLFSRHTPFSSPYHYGNYPPSYGHAPVSQQQYQARTQDATKGSTFSRAQRGRFDHVKSPNHGQMAPSVKKSILGRDGSQRSFKPRKRASAVKKGGFAMPKRRMKTGFRPSPKPRRFGGFGRGRRR